MKYCSRCQATYLVKNGWVGSLQRWLCKICGFSFTRSEPKGVPQAVKLLLLSCGGGTKPARHLETSWLFQRQHRQMVRPV
jgi:hypothetical protein